MRRLHTFAARSFGCCLTAVACCGALSAQSDVQITVARESVVAGDAVKGTVVFPEPLSCSTQVQVQFRQVGNATTGLFTLDDTVEKGATSVAVLGQVPFDTPPGEYHAFMGFLSPCRGYSAGHQFSVPPRTIIVKPYTDTTQYPSKADMILKPSQTQFLDTKIDELSDLDQLITTQLENHAADTKALRAFLKDVAGKAQKDLFITERQYRSMFLTTDGKLPAFFADFEQQYRDLLVDLNAPIPGTAEARTADSASLIATSYVVSFRSQHLDGGVKTSTTRSSDVISTQVTIHNNAEAYKYVKQTGRVTFDMQLTSIPTGATIQLKQATDPHYSPYSKPTDIRLRGLDLATWNFIVTLPGCADSPKNVTVTPYVDTQPVIGVHFQKCKVVR